MLSSLQYCVECAKLRASCAFVFLLALRAFIFLRAFLFVLYVLRVLIFLRALRVLIILTCLNCLHFFKCFQITYFHILRALPRADSEILKRGGGEGGCSMSATMVGRRTKF